MKTISTLGILLISIQISFAQESKLWLSLSSGLANSTASNKSNLIGNGVNFQADAFVPFYRKGWDGSVKGSGFMLGLNVSGNYASLKNLSPDNSFIQNEYQIFGGNLAVASQSSSKTSASFSGLLGLQGRFSFGKINISPSLNTGYLSFKKEGYVQTGNASINGQNRQIDLVTVEPQNTGGLIFKPQVKVGYNISLNIAFFVSPAMLMGHELTHTVQQRVPQGGFNDRKTYEADQLAKGIWESKTSTSKFNFSELNFGLSIALGKKKSGGEQARRRVEVLKSNKKGDPNSIVKDGQNTVEVSKPDTGVVSQRLSMTPTTVRQTQGQTFGEKVTSGLQTNGTTNTKNEATKRRRVEVLKSNKNTQMMPVAYNGKDPIFKTTQMSILGTGQALSDGTPIVSGKEVSGKIVGINAGTAVAIKQSETGDAGYAKTDAEGNFKITLGHDTLHRIYIDNKEFGKIKIQSEEGDARRVEVLKSNKEGDPNKNRFVNEGSTDAEGKSISQKGVRRNDVNGLENTEAVEEKSTPKHDTQMGAIRNIKARTTNPNENGKSIRTEGVKRSDIVAAPGQPIGGIVVKGGKNPGGNTINSVTNANGETTFTITAPGEYKLQVLEPQNNEQARVVTYKKKGVKITAETVAPTTNKSISGKGVRQTEAEAIVLGNPIGGIIVKGGKNPGGGNMINAVADENGEITFTAKEVGKYQIQVLAPESSQ